MAYTRSIFEKIQAVEFSAWSGKKEGHQVIINDNMQQPSREDNPRRAGNSLLHCGRSINGNERLLVPSGGELTPHEGPYTKAGVSVP